MKSLQKLAFNTLRQQYSNVGTRKLMKLQQNHQLMKNLNLFNQSKSPLSYVSQFRFTSENKCKNNPDKTCENKHGCHSKQHNHNHEHHHHHENGCCNHETKASTMSSAAYTEDPDIAKLKDLLNSFAKDGNHQHNHEHGCCGGHHHNHEQEVSNKQEHGCCGGKHKHNHDHHHEHKEQNLQGKQEHECCGGHHHHHDHEHHHHNHNQMNNHSHENNVQNNNHQNHEAEHHHHHHDGCCGHDHDHDHHHHHEHNTQPIDLEAIAKQKITEEEFVLNSGEQVKAVYSGDNTVSYSISENIKGVKARDPEHGQLVMIFTCTVCETRSSRSFTKKAYNEGIVLIRCETCDSLHLVADNLGWFNDHKSNIETIMEEKGEKVHKIDNSEQINDILSQFINRDNDSTTKNNENS